MLTAFWINDAQSQNVGGKTRQFETLQAVVDYAAKAKLAEKDDYFTVCNLAEPKVVVPLTEVVAVFEADHTPLTLAAAQQLVVADEQAPL